MRFQTCSNARYIASDECNVVEGACSGCIPLSAAKVALKTRLIVRLDANNVNDVTAIEIEPNSREWKIGSRSLREAKNFDIKLAWLRMAEIYDELGNGISAAALRKKAAELFKKFNQDFWDEESGFYAFALDGEKKKVLSVASNAGHCLWSGIIARERAAVVVKRLMRDDMRSGWGIRTLSADHPSFNPYNYQTGAVWPHDNALIALGMQRYGFAAEAAAVAREISAEILDRKAPRITLQSSIQPAWLPDVTLTDLRLGQERFEIRFWRDGNDTNFEVLKGRKDAVTRMSVALTWDVAAS